MRRDRGPQTGGPLNPARTSGLYLALGLFGGEVTWGQPVLYSVGPLLGAMVAAVLYEVVAETRRAQPRST